MGNMDAAGKAGSAVGPCNVGNKEKQRPTLRKAEVGTPRVRRMEK